MSLVLNTLIDYIREDKENIVIIEGTNGSGKTTLCQSLMNRWHYFKHLGYIPFDGRTYDPTILRNYRVHDRYRPIQDFCISYARLKVNNLEIKKEFIDYGLANIKDFTDKYLIKENKRPLFVFMVHSRYLTPEALRGRKGLTDEYLNGLEESQRLVMNYLSNYYNVLILDKNSMKYIRNYIGELEDETEDFISF